MGQTIQVPSDFRGVPELFLQPSVACHLVVNEFIEIGNGLIRGAPASIGHFKLSIFNNFLQLVFLSLVLPCVPHLQILYLREGELSLRIFEERVHYSIQLSLDKGMMDGHVGPGIILVRVLPVA